MPKHCSPVKVGGHQAIICGPNRILACSTCAEIADKVCDWKVRYGRTCDAPICDDHVHQVGPNKHLCPKHAAEWEDHPANRQGKLDL